MSISHINGEILKRMIIAGANKLEEYKQAVDELNVFPVPDGDTGTNMSLTVLSAAREVEKITSDNINEIVKAAASGSLRGARGNSGVILSQLFRGFAKGIQNHKQIDTFALADAFETGVKTAYKAVMKPKEGTILTVAREGAEKALQIASEIINIEDFLKEVISYAHTILQKTPDMLPVLKQAGVVDAGGRGLLYILEGALEALNINGKISLKQNISQNKEVAYGALASINNEDITFGYCTEFIINRSDNNPSNVNELREFLNTIGDSIVVVEDEEIIKVHVHTDHPGQAIEKGLTYGSLTNMKIDNMREQHTTKVVTEEIKETETLNQAVKEEKEIGFIAVASGEGISQIFKDLGVDYIIKGGQTMNPSTEDILNAAYKVNAKKIIVLPNNKNIILAAEQAEELIDGKEILVVPSKTIPQGIAAMIGYEPNRGIEETLNSMKESMSYVKTGQLTFAVRDTSIENREIKQGDIIGLIEGNIEVVSNNLEEATKELINNIVDEDSEIVSIYYGEDVEEKEAQKVKEYIEENYPDCEVEIHFGGQSLYYYILSVE
ncbi:DAK2 domain-containing protein [Defluviitalea phaphyphila]|uniref:DAK2 domain-containing protein n=1 Tax=Defluviitalea phaphyphila TaxID=1473580 RepID=UPI000731D308|nr:DAK2 domain-containing protein [Defluviitalea phaphyphila]